MARDQLRAGTAWAAAALCAIATVAFAQDPQLGALPPPEGTFTGEGYYERKDEGWFWKAREPEPLEPVPEEDPDPPVVAPGTPPAAPVEAVPAATEPAGPRPLSAEWLREALPRYRDRALNHPTQDNVAAFFYLQRYSVDMAERFALQAQRVVMADPVLDENSRRPQSMFGAEVIDRQAQAGAERAMAVIADEAGLWYFYRSDCPYCAAQSPVLENLAQKADMAVMAIALDDAPLLDGHFPDWRPNGGQAEMLQVRATPTIYLVRPPGEFLLIAEGVMAESTLRERIIHRAHEAGWISDEVFNGTRRVNRIYLAGTQPMTAEELEDPRRLVEVLRASVAEGMPRP